MNKTSNKTATNPKGTKQLIRRATFFVQTIKNKFDEGYWSTIIDGARAYLPDAKSKRRRGSSSGSGSGPGPDDDESVVDPDADFVMEL